MVEDYSGRFLGKTVKVKVDRPLGSKHPKWGFEYKLNYGFIEGVKAPDGEDLDAYVLGIDEPVKEFSGICIAIIKRTDDDDDKLIISNKEFSDEDIDRLTEFQEKFFMHKIIRN